MTGPVSRETPHSEISYAGFWLKGFNGFGLWCPECGIAIAGAVHRSDGLVFVVHHEFRTSRFKRDKWKCVIQRVG